MFFGTNSGDYTLCVVGILCILCGTHSDWMNPQVLQASMPDRSRAKHHRKRNSYRLDILRNVLATHEAFLLSGGGGSVTNYDFSDKGLLPNSHDTQVAGIIVSQGSAQHPDCLGIAPDSRIHSARISRRSTVRNRFGPGIGATDRQSGMQNRGYRRSTCQQFVLYSNGSSTWAKCTIFMQKNTMSFLPMHRGILKPLLQSSEMAIMV
jgi:hypothetical protein